MINKCLECKKEFKTYPSKIKVGKAKYCSYFCYNKNKKGPWKKGTRFSEEYKQKLSKCRMGQKSGMKGKHHSLETKKKISRVLKEKGIGFQPNYIPWNKGKKCDWEAGKKSYWWKGGITKKRFEIYNSLEYKLWRKAVFERDNYTCRFCNQRGGKIEADHIKPFALYPELRFAIDNGRTLCKECHMTTETYGGRCLRLTTI